MFLQQLSMFGESLADSYAKIQGQPSESVDLGELPVRHQVRLSDDQIPGSPGSRTVGVSGAGIPAVPGIGAILVLGMVLYLLTSRRK